MSQPQNPPGQGDKPFRVEYIHYEAPSMLDADSLAKESSAGDCGICITGGNAAVAEEAPES